jgi:hypothetical protein
MEGLAGRGNEHASERNVNHAIKLLETDGKVVVDSGSDLVRIPKGGMLQLDIPSYKELLRAGVPLGRPGRLDVGTLIGPVFEEMTQEDTTEDFIMVPDTPAIRAALGETRAAAAAAWKALYWPSVPKGPTN